MSEKKVDKNCIICKNTLSIGEAIYVSKVELTDKQIGTYNRKKINNSFRVIFSKTKNPKGAMHKECWENLFGKIIKSNKKISGNKDVSRLQQIK